MAYASKLKLHHRSVGCWQDIVNYQSLVSGKKNLLFDSEGGRMFIVMDISDKATPKVVVCV